MENIKEELKKVITEVMLPETEGYLEDLNKAIKGEMASDDDLAAKEDIEAFINELKTIIEVVDEGKLSDDEAKGIYEKIIFMLNEHEDEEH
jgi:hypothetical protein